MSWTRRLLFTVTLLPGTMTSSRIYVPVEVQQVPLSRLSANLRRAMHDEPRNPRWVHNLARAHAMAWATRTEQLPVAAYGRSRFESPNRDSAARNANAVWFGYEPDFVPFKSIVDAVEGKRLQFVSAHLDTALVLYGQAIALDTTDLTIRLGQAWLLTQTSARRTAIPRLRAIVGALSTSDSRNLNRSAFGPRSLMAEAARYLIPLLDPARDNAEIATLQRQIREEESRPRAVTPIAVPMSDRLEARDMEDRSASVAFDADGTALLKRWSWIRPNAAWLVHDPRQTGRVTSALQLFGSVTFWMFWGNGYDALASLDDDGDGSLRGRELDGLALWHDVNGNGLSERGEIRPVSYHGIVALHCRGTRDPTHPDRIFRAAAGVTYRDGTTRPTYDLMLHQRASSVVAQGTIAGTRHATTTR